MKKSLIPFIVCVLVACSGSKKKFNILPLSPFAKDNSYDSINQRFQYYIVEGYRDSKDQFDKIQEFALQKITPGDSNYDARQINFYKETSKTNSAFKESPEDIIEWHGDDLVYTFTWKKGRYLGYFKYKSGKIINGGNVEVKNVTE